MDMTESLIAKSDQLNAVDLTEPRTFTIEKITLGSKDQPFDFHLVELPGRPYRPSKGMRRIIAQAWGATNVGETYPGRRLTLYCDMTVRWAGQPVGGIRISHMSHIAAGFEAPLAESKQKRIMYRVEALPDLPAPAPPVPTVTAEMVAASTSVTELQTWWQTADPGLRELIEARAAEVKAATA